MDLLNSIYSKSIAENEKQLQFWEEYLKSLINLEFDVYSNKLSVPIMVPVGSRILFRGELKHTNEVTISLGADYFVKCSLYQADILKQHRIKDAQSKVSMLRREKEYLENQIEYGRQTVKHHFGQEIIEAYSEEEDKLWRKKHRENIRQYKKQNKNKSQNKEVTDEEIWNRLDELELHEELEMSNILKVESHKMNKIESLDSFHEMGSVFNKEQCNINSLDFKSVSELNREEFEKSESTSNIDILQKILERQNELEEKLQKIKNGKVSKCISKKDLEERLDEIEQLDELEDDIVRLSDSILQSNTLDYDKEQNPVQEINKKVTFLDEDDSETLEISFKHSAVTPSLDPYIPSVGIQKPNDIYSAYDSLFNEQTYSILKKTSYNSDKEAVNNLQNVCEKRDDVINKQHKTQPNNTIIINDVKEKQKYNITTSKCTDVKPMSIFKKQRMKKRYN